MKLKLETLTPQEILSLRKLILDGKEVEDIFLCYVLEGFEEEIWVPLCERTERRLEVFKSNPLDKGREPLETIVELLTWPAYVREEQVASNIRRSVLTSEEPLTLGGFLDVLAHYVLEELKLQEEFESLGELKDIIKVLKEEAENE